MHDTVGGLKDFCIAPHTRTFRTGDTTVQELLGLRYAASERRAAMGALSCARPGVPSALFVVKTCAHFSDLLVHPDAVHRA